MKGNELHFPVLAECRIGVIAISGQYRQLFNFFAGCRTLVDLEHHISRDEDRCGHVVFAVDSWTVCEGDDEFAKRRRLDFLNVGVGVSGQACAVDFQLSDFSAA